MDFRFLSAIIAHASVRPSVQQIGALREQIISMETKNRNLKEYYRKGSQDFREVCYMLFGYRVDRIGALNFRYVYRPLLTILPITPPRSPNPFSRCVHRIASMYASNENHYLNFRFEEGGLDMLVSDYSLTLGDMVNEYLNVRRSLPAFLCTLNLELFNRMTLKG